MPDIKHSISIGVEPHLVYWWPPEKVLLNSGHLT